MTLAPTRSRIASGAARNASRARRVRRHSFRAFVIAAASPALALARRVRARRVVVARGWGRGLSLGDLGVCPPPAPPHGYAIPPAMTASGRQLAGVKLTLEPHDVTARPLPQAAGSVDLVSMSSVLHVFDEPLP